MQWLAQLKSRLTAAAPVDEMRWVMLDVETSGLNMQRDRLLSIAAVALRVDWPNAALRVDLGDSFEVVLGQTETSTKSNILLHGIGVQRQLGGVPPTQAMQAFTRFVGHSPLLAFHAAFDQTLITRYARTHLGTVLPNPWVDLDHLCAVTYEDVRARTLDDWLAHFGIRCAVRHQAAADTLAQCELLQRIWARIAVQCKSWTDVRRLAALHRWMPRPI
jgi:DNA polymerase III subunit epsilon